jgi:hypothetical protein
MNAPSRQLAVFNATTEREIDIAFVSLAKNGLAPFSSSPMGSFETNMSNSLHWPRAMRFRQAILGPNLRSSGA